MIVIVAVVIVVVIVSRDIAFTNRAIKQNVYNVVYTVCVCV